MTKLLKQTICNETLSKPMEWSILSRNLKFDRHLNKAICVSACRRLTNRFCYGKRFLNVVVTQKSKYLFFNWGHCQRTLLVWKNFISNNFRPNKLFKLQQILHQQQRTFHIAYRHRSHIKVQMKCFFLFPNLKEQQKSGRSPFTVS